MRRLFALALLLLAVPAQGATRLYFGNQRPTAAQGDFTITPAADSAWEDASQIARATMHIGTPYRARGFHTAYRNVNLTPSSPNQDLDMQLQMKLDAGITFTSGVTTVAMQAGIREDPNTSDVNQIHIGIRIIDDDGTTVNATLLPVANYGTTVELDDTLSSFRNKTIANGDTVTSTYTTVAGDWLVLEIGYQNDGATGAVSVVHSGLGESFGWSTTNSSGAVAITDCPVDETTLRCVGWIQFSNTITSPAESNGPASRFYLPASTAAPVTPSGFQSADWSAFNEVTYYRMVKTKGSSAITDGQTVDLPVTGFAHEVDRVFVSGPMAAGAIFTGGTTSVTGQILVRESNLDDNLLALASKLWISDITGATVLAELYRYPGPVGATEFPVTATKGNRPIFSGSVVSDSYTTTGGERLILELGFNNSPYTNLSPAAIASYGESAADCAGPRVLNSSASDCAPWIEFSNAITITDEATSLPRAPFFGRLLMADPVGVFRSLLGRWLQ